MISARRGEFETGFERGGQTREHAMLVRTAGVRHLVIVVNKMDDPTVEWEESRCLIFSTNLTFLHSYYWRYDLVCRPCQGVFGNLLSDS